MMLKGLEISNFRGFKSLQVSGICSVTLIAGRNNSGKSSLLEAVELLANVSNPLAMAGINAHRELGCGTVDDVRAFFHGRDDSRAVSIRGEFDGGLTRRISLSRHLLRSGDLQAGTAGSSFDPVAYELTYGDFQQGKDAEAGRVAYRSKPDGGLSWTIEASPGIVPWACEYCTAGGEPHVAEIIEHLVETCQEDWLLEFLRKIDSNVLGLVPTRNEILVQLENPRTRIPLQLMGDGILKTVKILGLMCAAGAGGVVCVDEIDNGLHYSVMRDFLKKVVEVAQQRGVQLLMTTHNIELLKFAASTFADSQSLFGYLRMIHYASGDAVAFPYASAEFASSVKGGVELR